MHSLNNNLSEIKSLSKEQLLIAKLRAQHALLKFTIDQTIELPVFKENWADSVSFYVELERVIDAMEADLEKVKAS